MQWKVPLADISFDEQEEAAVLKVLRDGWLTMGSVTQDFESSFANLISVKHAFAVSNATVALHLACLSLGVGPGDEVIIPSLTFVATANAILYTSATVRFADIVGFDNFNISPQAIEKQITPKTKAIIVVHYGGYPCRMKEIMEIAEKNGLSVIEDAAHAPGASLDGVSLGGWGDIACFSFFSNKNLATGEGGMLVTNRDDVAKKVKVLRSHGMTSVTWDRHKGHAYSYDVVDLGYNYRIDELRSAIGKVQLEKLPWMNKQRKEITMMYRERLDGIDVSIPFENSPGVPAYHIFPVLLPEKTDRKRVIDHLRTLGIQTSIHYPPIHKFTYYSQLYPKQSLPVTEEVSEREITLPLYPAMNKSDVESVVDAMNTALK